MRRAMASNSSPAASASRLQRLDLIGELPGAGEQRLPLLPLGARDLLAQRLLLGPRPLEVGERGAAPLVSREHGVDQLLVGSAGALAGADGLRVLTQAAQVDHIPRLVDGLNEHGVTIGSATTGYRAAMPFTVDAVDVVAVGAVVGAVAVGVRVWRPRRRRPASPATAPVNAEGAEPPWAVVVANPTKIADIQGEIDWLEERSVELGWARPVWLETTPDDPGLGQGRVALRAGAHTVLAYGGDGTVRAVATALIGSNVPLGCCPRARATCSRAT